MTDRPTAADLADAADRLINALDEARAALTKASGILHERQERGGSGRSGPLFPFIGEDIYRHLDKAREALRAAHNLAAIQGYDERRKTLRGEQ